MEVQISPQRHAQLSDYAERHGQDAAAALDEVLAAALEWGRLDFTEAIEGIRLGYEDMKAGRMQPAEEMFEEVRVKHAFRVETTARAKQDLDNILTWLLSRQAGDAGLRWFQGLRDAVASLNEAPDRCRLASENEASP